MKKFLSVLFMVCLFIPLMSCKADTSPIVGSWKTTTPIFGTETDLEEICLIFYAGFEGEEKQTKRDANRTYNSSYQFDYEVTEDTLTIYTGDVQYRYTISYGESDSSETMQLTAEDGTVYSYTLSSRTTPGIYS